MNGSWGCPSLYMNPVIQPIHVVLSAWSIACFLSQRWPLCRLSTSPEDPVMGSSISPDLSQHSICFLHSTHYSAHMCVFSVYFQSLLLDYKLPQGIFYIFLVHYYTKASILCRISQAIRKCYVNEWLHE